MNFHKIKVGITQGDINGIGYEVIIKTLKDSKILDMCIPIIYGSPKIATYHKKSIGEDSFNFNITKSANKINSGKINIVDSCGDNIKIELGQSTETSGKASYQALEAATNDLKEGLIDVLITAPICKDSINQAGFEFPGHTEYLASKLEAKSHLMLMVSESLKVGVVTGHIPITEVAASITPEKIIEKIEVVHKSLVEDFAVTNPRIAVLGLNPHAGDEGVIGVEDRDIVAPAIKKMMDRGVTTMGPFAADGFFGKGMYKKFDAVIAMYHDQGLIPFKTLSFDSGVNFTAGLSAVRVSPGHGTAFDIAGKGVASEVSFRNALYRGIDLFRNREMYREMSSEPLKISPKQNKNRGRNDVH